MLVIRFRRIGKKKKPTYRIVVAEHTFPVNGKYTEDLGSYNPHTKATTLNKDKALVWLNKGATPSNSVAKLLKNEKVKHGLVVIVKRNKKSKQEQAETAAKTPVNQEVKETEPTTEAVEEQKEESPEEPTTEESSEKTKS